MRRQIRFTGRKQLAHSSVEIKLLDTEKGKRVLLTLKNPDEFKTMSSSACLKLRLFENKISETLVFSSLGEVRRRHYAIAELRRPEAFSAPSAQLRVVATEDNRRGLVLGSTRKWTLRMEGDGAVESSIEGILQLQTLDIAPRVWRLQPRDEEHPIVYIDKQVPNPSAWVQTDPVFISCVLPAIIREVFDHIFTSYGDTEQEWVNDWISWAERLTQDNDIPWGNDEIEKRNEWIENLLEAFCRQHDMLKNLVGKLDQDGST